MTTIAKSNSASRDETVIVPVISLEEMPRLTSAQRKTLIADLKRSEAAMKSGKYVTYSPEWLKQRFREVYNAAHR
ncbi:hypothetical protein HY968_00970 [Candidatus Kaiserbacteria bacterium]|nr:hypothetical protein [Candidatus Kaiserbacteria bacterium]